MAKKSNLADANIHDRVAVIEADEPQTGAVPDHSTTNPPVAEAVEKPETPTERLFALAKDSPTHKVQELVDAQIAESFGNDEVAKSYRVILLSDETRIVRADADRIYGSLASGDRSKPILLILSSPGGEVPAAYFIGKLCREYTDSSFQVAVAREAKSAATLISCAADRIHMGSLSELGPIDPQIRQMPALSVKHSLEHLAEVATRYPDSHGMLSQYLAKSLPIEVLGYYERAAHSAVQYAERLLGSRKIVASTSEANSTIAKRLVYEFKDHSFAIDHTEATAIFGPDVIVKNTPEYELANQIYQTLDFLSMIVSYRFRCDLAYTGGLGAGAWVRKKPD